MLNKYCLGIVLSAMGVRSQGNQKATNEEHLYFAAALLNLTSLYVYSTAFNQMLPLTVALKLRPVGFVVP